MSLIKRGTIYWMTFSHQGKRYRETTKTSDLAAAQAFEQKRIDEILTADAVGYTVAQAVELWMGLNTHKKDRVNDELKARYFIAKCGQEPLEKITRARMIELLSEKATAATKNRYSSFMSGVMTEAAEHNWIAIAPRYKYFQEEKREVELPKEFEFKMLWAALPHPHSQAAQFALATGLRQANVYQLTWDQVDFDGRTVLINGSQMKNGKALRVPLNDEAYDCIMACQSLHAVYVFGGKVVNHRTWKNALKRALLPPDTRWHDLRHYWASSLAKAGTPLLKIKALGGWSSITLLDRYAHLSPIDCGQ